METLRGKEGLTILRRLLAYSEKVFQPSKTVIAGVVDPTSAAAYSDRLRRQIGGGFVLESHEQPQCVGTDRQSGYFCR